MASRLLYIFLSFLILKPLLSQNLPLSEIDTTDKLRFGLIGGVSLINNQTSIPLYPFGGDCGSYSDGDDIGYYAGLAFNYKIIPDFILADFRAYYEKRPLTLSLDTSHYEVYVESRDDYEMLVRGFRYDAELQYIALDFGIKVNAFYPFEALKGIPLYLRGGLEAGEPLIGTNFENSEQIISPIEKRYPDETKRLIIESGKLTEAGTATGAYAGITTDIKLASGMIVSPEITYRWGLNSPVEEYDWTSNIIRAGVGISWEFGGGAPEPEPEPEPEKEPEIIADTVVPQVIVKKNIILELDDSVYDLTETVVTQTYPLLPYIFFDEASSEIKQIYIHPDLKREEFTEEGLPKETLGIYYLVLDIIGNRLRASSGTSITITGFTDGSEMQDIQSRGNLAIARAEAIADYMFVNWGISRDRMNIKWKETPELATSTAYNEGFQENRRVEISSSYPTILEPVIHSKFLEFAASDGSFGFDNKVESGRDIEMWSFELIAGDEIIFNTSKSDGSVPPEFLTITPGNQLLQEIGRQSSVGQDIKARLTVNEENGNVSTKTSKLSLSRERTQFEIGRLNLIVFDFDRSEISDQNQLMLRDFVESSIHTSSTVKITGSTDRLGELKYNKELSLARAKSVETYIRGINPKAEIQEVKGIGPSNLQYDNTLPEGRFYCRTVLIEVKTPLDSQ